MLRKGATGKPLTTDLTRELGFDYLSDFITYGSPAGMPNWGTSGQFGRDDSRPDGALLLNDPPQPPELGHARRCATAGRCWCRSTQRPTKQMNKLDIDNLFSVTLRDSGEIALIDGD